MKRRLNVYISILQRVNLRNFTVIILSVKTANSKSPFAQSRMIFYNGTPCIPGNEAWPHPTDEL